MYEIHRDKVYFIFVVVYTITTAYFESQVQQLHVLYKAF